MKNDLENVLPAGHLYDISFIDEAREIREANEEFEELHYMDEDIYPAEENEYVHEESISEQHI